MEAEKRDGVTILSTGESLNVETAPKLKEAVKELAKESGIKLVIDMKDTRIIDSSGCGALVASLRALRSNKGDIKVARPTPQALTIFQLTRLHKVFDIHDSVEDAIKAFS